MCGEPRYSFRDVLKSAFLPEIAGWWGRDCRLRNRGQCGAANFPVRCSSTIPSRCMDLFRRLREQAPHECGQDGGPTATVRWGLITSGRSCRIRRCPSKSPQRSTWSPRKRRNTAAALKRTPSSRQAASGVPKRIRSSMPPGQNRCTPGRSRPASSFAATLRASGVGVFDRRGSSTNRKYGFTAWTV